MDFDYRLPDTEVPAITVRRSALGRISVLVDGAPSKGRDGVHEIAGSDGTPHYIRVVGAWTGLRVIGDGWDTALESARPLWSLALIFAPLFLVIGGLIGATLGVIGVGVNAAIARTALRLPLRVVAMLLVVALGLAGWIGAGAFLTGVSSARVSYRTGTCLEGITPSTDLVSQAPATVDCGTAHDAEVVGTFNVEGSAYPGDRGLLDVARQQCPGLFASYVGVAFDQSRLDILPVVPTQIAWEAGSREVSCVALTQDGTKLTGPIKGTGQ